MAPKEHREQVTGDFTMQEYIDLQRLVYRVTEAVREEVGAEFDDLSFERVFSSNVYGLLLGVEGTSPLDAPLEGDDQIRQTHLR